MNLIKMFAIQRTSENPELIRIDAILMIDDEDINICVLKKSFPEIYCYLKKHFSGTISKCLIDITENFENELFIPYQ